MAHWFTADPHFFHHNILRFCKRPFANVEEMNNTIVANLRTAVKPTDHLWILGDLTMDKNKDKERVQTLFRQIPGKKHLIIGNHDRAPWVRHDLPWESVQEVLHTSLENRRVTLCHYPMVTWPGVRHGALMLFGHVHNNWKGSRNCVNVGVDVWDFRPVCLDEIAARAETLPPNPIWETAEPGLPSIAPNTPA